MQLGQKSVFTKELISKTSETFMRHSLYGDYEVVRTTSIEKWTGNADAGIYAGKAYENKMVWENDIVTYSHNQPWERRQNAQQNT
jgi:hypothetical protein